MLFWVKQGNIPHGDFNDSSKKWIVIILLMIRNVTCLLFFFHRSFKSFKVHFSYCAQEFSTWIFLTLQVHTLDRVFQCSQCEKGFKEMRTLRLHLKIHNAEYPEQCSVCQKVFRTKWQLKQHQMDHGGERPYPCPECSFTCKTKQQLNEHRRKHSVSQFCYITDLLCQLLRWNWVFLAKSVLDGALFVLFVKNYWTLKCCLNPKVSGRVLRQK